MSIAARPLTYNAYHNPVSYEEPGRPLNLPSSAAAAAAAAGGGAAGGGPGAEGSNELGITRGGHHNNTLLYPEQQQPAFPALHLFSLNNTFAPKHILLGPPTVTPTSRLKIGRQTSQKTAPNPSNTFFDSKVLSRTHAELWAEHGKIYIRDLRSSNGTFINGNRLSPEGCESEPCEIKNEDLIEFGIDIVAEDGQQILHHKVAARAFTILDAHAADRAQHDWTNLYRTATLTGMGHDGQGPNGAGVGGAGGAGGGGAGSNVGVGPGGSVMGPGAEGGLRRGKGGKSFDHVIALLQAEMSRLTAAGAGGPEAAAARAAAAAAKHRQRAKSSRSPGGPDDAQGSDGAPLSPLDETAQRLTLLLSSLSITRSQLDAIRAASNNAKPDTAAAAEDSTSPSSTSASAPSASEEDQPTLTPPTPANEPSEDEINSATLKILATPAIKPSAGGNAGNDEQEPSPSPVAPIPAAAIAAAARLPALRDSLSTLRLSVHDVRASLLSTLRERELREADEQLVNTSMRSGSAGGAGNAGGRRVGLGQGLSMGVPSGSQFGGLELGAGGFRFAGDDSGSQVGLRSGAGMDAKFSFGGGGVSGLPSSSYPSSSSSLLVGSPASAQQGGGGGLLGSPPKEPLPSLPRGDEGGAPLGANAWRRGKMRASDLLMTSSRPSWESGELVQDEEVGHPEPLEPDWKASAPPPPKRSSVDLPLADEDGSGAGLKAGASPLLASGAMSTSRKRSADEHFETEDAEAELEAKEMHRGEGEEAARQAETETGGLPELPEGLSVSVQGSGTAPSGPSSSSAPTPIKDADTDAEAEHSAASPPATTATASRHARGASTATITAARLDRAEAALEELRGMLAQVEQARKRNSSAPRSGGPISASGAAAAATSPSSPSSAAAATTADLVARLDRLERSILVRRAEDTSPLPASAGAKREGQGQGQVQEEGGLAALRERWLGAADVVPVSGYTGTGGGGAAGETKVQKTKAELVWDGLQNKFAANGVDGQGMGVTVDSKA
ncbi:hypothetical protein OC844_002256 [Tilletia horrida]|nr:hypothetical protein OC844_002256 [Tilletia horrida]